MLGIDPIGLNSAWAFSRTEALQLNTLHRAAQCCECPRISYFYFLVCTQYRVKCYDFFFFFFTDLFFNSTPVQRSLATKYFLTSRLSWMIRYVATIWTYLETLLQLFFDNSKIWQGYKIKIIFKLRFFPLTIVYNEFHQILLKRLRSRTYWQSSL